MKKFVNQLIPATGSAALFMLLNEIGKLGKLHFIIGSTAAFFSLNQCITPFIGSYGGLASTTLFFFLRSAFTSFSAPHLGLLLLVYHIPSFLGALAFDALRAPDRSLGASESLNTRRFASTTRIKKIALGALIITCMALFLAHPIGFYAAPYTLLWLIPLTALALNKTGIFVQALISTFTTHAVGSVIMLYSTDTLTAANWISIMPIALIERFIFAVGTTICYYSIQRICIWITHTKQEVAHNL